MRFAWVLLAMLTLIGSARADSRLIKQYAGRIIVSPEPPPTIDSELAAYIKRNIAADDQYELIKGPPWSMHLIGLVAKDSGPVTLVFTDVETKQPLQSIEVSLKQGMMIAHTQATVAAGFQAARSYRVTLEHGKAVVAKATLRLRP